MPEYDSPLDNIKIASPCSANWNAMIGDDRKRFCGDCKLNVYNLSGMTRYDAEHLLRMSEGRLCVRYFQRPDGTILTKDCPVGWAKLKQRVAIMATAAFSLMVSVFGAIFVISLFRSRTSSEPLMGAIAIERPTPTPRAVEVMGNVAVSPEPRYTDDNRNVVVGRVFPTDPPKLVRQRKSTAVH